ncbi:MAG: hypothetical protein EXS37_20645 [Opitutus sp.]|nr:hypothetical protein [Opitutus sp.]
MNHILDNSRHPWARLTSAARACRDDRDVTAPYGFATRVAALALAQERKVVSLIERFALRALGVSCLLALSSVALNYGLLGANAEDELFPTSDAVAVVFDLAD